MSIELKVNARLQETPMSCWWTAVAVVLEYYGRRYRYPWQYQAEFERPWNRSPTSIGFEPPSIDEAMRHDPTLRSMPMHPDPRQRDRLAPYEWYALGVPNTAWGLRRLRAAVRFQAVPDCPAYGSWTAADFDRILRACGPIVFHGFWNNFPHSLVVCGINEGAHGTTVAYMDPALGFVTSEPILNFNQRMAGMVIGPDAMGANPIHYPDSRPVRAVVDQS